MAVKKNFKDSARNAAALFLSESDATIPDGTDNTETVYYTHNTHNTDDVYTSETPVERKDKRLNLLLPSSLHKKLKKIAFVKQTSVNNLICEVLSTFTEENEIYLERYDSFLEKRD